jgi:hypothetical protein
MHLKAALGGADLHDGRAGRVNIATYRAPAPGPRKTTLMVVGDRKTG